MTALPLLRHGLVSGRVDRFPLDVAVTATVMRNVP